MNDLATSTKDMLGKRFSLGVKVDLEIELCEGSIFGKAHRLKFAKRPRAKNPRELIHSDVYGPFDNSISGNRYFIVFKVRKEYHCMTKHIKTRHFIVREQVTSAS